MSKITLRRPESQKTRFSGTLWSHQHKIILPKILFFHIIAIQLRHLICFVGAFEAFKISLQKKSTKIKTLGIYWKALLQTSWRIVFLNRI
jgi:hypothetical protein